MVAENHHIPHLHVRRALSKRAYAVALKVLVLKPLNQNQVFGNITFQLCTPTSPLIEGKGVLRNQVF
jgi:hypothetical protein